MKIVFVIDSLSLGGAEKNLAEILNFFTDKNNLKVIHLDKRNNLKSLYDKYQIETFCLEHSKNDSYFKVFRSLKKIFLKEKPDLIVSLLYKSSILTKLISINLNIPLVGTIVSDNYSSQIFEKLSVINKVKLFIYYLLDVLLARIPALYIANSNYIRLSVSKRLLFSKKKVKLLYTPKQIPINSWKPFFHNSSKFNFLTYGRLLEIKGFKELILAFKSVLIKHPNSTLNIVGEGPYKKELISLVLNLDLKDFIFFPGTIENVENQLINYNCFVFPSWYEGFSGALVEAMMAGIPIIASDIPMNLEAVQDKKTALVFPVRNVDALADQMIYAIEHPEEMAEMGRRAREIAINRFDINLIAQQYEEVLWNVYHRYAQKA